MDAIKSIKALGIMSGATLEGVNISLIETDGVDVYKSVSAETIPFSDDLREKLKNNSNDASSELSKFQAEAVQDFLKYHDQTADVIGVSNALSLEGSQMLADLTHTKVVSNFKEADILAGGQGGPLFPVYHEMLTRDMPKPLAVINIGGISSLTWMGTNGEMLAFDTGPGNAVINDWCFKKGDHYMDYNGRFAAMGNVDEKVVASLMRHKIFAKYPPKIVTKEIFKDKLEHLEGLSLEDGAATATAFIAESISYSLSIYLPILPKTLILCGGGAKNPTLVRFIRHRLLDIKVETAAELGWDADSIESQTFAYLAARRLFGLPATFPSTTGAFEPIICGKVFAPISQ